MSPHHQFRYTTASRAEKSLNWCNRGIWGKDVESSIKYPTPIENDPLIRVKHFILNQLKNVNHLKSTINCCITF